MGAELASVKAMLDRTHPPLPTKCDQNSYVLGEIAGHNIVIAVLPEAGTNSAATAAIQLLNDFPCIRFGLLVGVGGGMPDEEEDVRLGDVVVSKPTDTFGSEPRRSKHTLSIPGHYAVLAGRSLRKPCRGGNV